MKQNPAEGKSTAEAVAEARRGAQAKVNAEKRRTVVTWTVVGVILVGLVSALIAFIVRQGAVDDVPAPGEAGTPTVSVDGGFGVGSSGIVGRDLDPDHVRLDVYFDFLCPFCGLFETSQAEMLDGLRSEGVVDVYYHPVAYQDSKSEGTNYSTRAASAAALIAQETPEAFGEFLQLLMVNQPEEFTPGLSDEQLQAFATEAGVPDEVVARIPQHEYAAWVRTSTEAASKAGVLYTPTLSFNGEMQDPSLPTSVQWAQEGALEQAIRDLAAAK